MQSLGAVSAHVARATRVSSPSRRAETLQVAASTVVELPHTLVRDEVSPLFQTPVLIERGGTASTITVRNQMPISWQVETTNESGTLGSELAMPGSEVTLPCPAPGCNVAALQNLETLLETVVELANQEVRVLLQFVPASSCPASEIRALLREHYDQQGQGSFLDVVRGVGVSGHAVALRRCLPEGLVRSLLEVVAQLRSGLARLAAAVIDVPTLLRLGAFAEYYADGPASVSPQVGICKSYIGNIVPCATSFEIGPQPLYMAPDAIVQLDVAAYRGGQTTVRPPGLQFASSSPTTAFTSDAEMRVLAVSPSNAPATITVTDAWTGARGQAAVWVVMPEIHPATAEVANSTAIRAVTFRLSDSEGHTVRVPEVEWRTNDTRNRISGTTVLSGLDVNTATFVVAANAEPGVVEVTVFNRRTGVPYGTATITVLSDAPVAELYRIAYGDNCGTTGIGTCGGTQPPIMASQTSTQSSSTGPTRVATSQVFVGTTVMDGSAARPLPFAPTICKVGGQWVPMNYTWTVTTYTPQPSGGSCTGGFRQNFGGSVSIDNANLVTIGFTRDTRNDQVCTFPSYTQTAVSVNQAVKRHTVQLTDGSGTFSATDNTRTDRSQTSQVYPSTSSWTATEIAQSASWPAETTVPPQLAGLHLHKTRDVFASEPLPSECRRP